MQLTTFNSIQVILQGLPWGGFEFLIEACYLLHTIKAKVAEGVAQFAPCGEGPDFAPVEDAEWVDGTAGGGAIFAGVVEADFALLFDCFA